MFCPCNYKLNGKHYSSDFWLSKLPPENDTVTIHHLHNTLNWPGPHHFLLSTSICHLSVTYFSMSCLRSAALWCGVQAWISWENVFFLDNCRVFLKPPTPIPVWEKGIYLSSRHEFLLITFLKIYVNPKFWHIATKSAKIQMFDLLQNKGMLGTHHMRKMLGKVMGKREKSI